MSEGCAKVGKYLMESGERIYVPLFRGIIRLRKVLRGILDEKQRSKWPGGFILLPLMCSQEERVHKKIKTNKHTVLWPENPSRGH